MCSAPLLTNCKIGKVFLARQVHDGALQTAFRPALVKVYAAMCWGTCCVFCTCTAIDGPEFTAHACLACPACFIMMHVITQVLKGKFDIFNKPFEFTTSGDFLVIGCLFIILGTSFKNYDC